MAEQDNVDLVKRGFEAFNKGDVDTLAPMFDDDAVQHMPGNNILSGDHTGKDAILGMYGKIAEESGGTFQAPLVDATADGPNRVIAKYRGTGQRNGKSYDKPHTLTFTIDNGKFKDLDDAASDVAAFDDFWA